MHFLSEMLHTYAITMTKNTIWEKYQPLLAVGNPQFPAEEILLPTLEPLEGKGFA